MTPLAAAIAKNLTLPESRRNPGIDISFSSRLMKEFRSEVHYFECSGVFPLAMELARSVTKISMEQDKEAVFSGRVFLPAPRTWIEWKYNSPYRQAVLLADTNDGWANIFVVAPPQILRIGRISTETSDFERSPFKIIGAPGADIGTVEGHQRVIDNYFSMAHHFLVMINTPRIIGRRQHMPNRALEKTLTRHFGRGGFPLLAWTEIELRVSKPAEIDDGEPHEAHLTGQRALHFCRAHLRVRNGRVEYVTSHWRGDPAIGIKQSRYSVVA